MVLHDALASLKRQNDEYYQLNDINAMFKSVTEVRYGEKVNIPNTELSIMAYASGRIIGGSIWKIQREPVIFFL